MSQIEVYAKQNGITLSSQEYKSYTMIRRAKPQFPLLEIFVSENRRGRKDGKPVTIISKGSSITHLVTEDVLERPYTKNKPSRLSSPCLKIKYPDLEISLK